MQDTKDLWEETMGGQNLKTQKKKDFNPIGGKLVAVKTQPRKQKKKKEKKKSKK